MTLVYYLRGGIVVPLDGRHDWFDPGVVVLEKGQITFVGPAASAPPPTEGAVVHDCADRIIMPGLVNAHTHTGMNYFRNLLEDLTSSDWFAREQVAEKQQCAANRPATHKYNFFFDTYKQAITDIATGKAPQATLDAAAQKLDAELAR